jgi:hypothetical protein
MVYFLQDMSPWGANGVLLPDFANNPGMMQAIQQMNMMQVIQQMSQQTQAQSVVKLEVTLFATTTVVLVSHFQSR